MRTHMGSSECSILGGRSRLLAVALVTVACTACSVTADAPREPIVEEPTFRGRQPYAYTTPVPPLRTTPADGTFVRRVTAAQAGGVPVACRRCAPYRLDAGETTLVLDRGRFFVAFRPSGATRRCPTCTPPGAFHATGHFVVDGDQITLFNDAECTEDRGIYTWVIAAGRLSFEPVEDPCFGGIRARFLPAAPWERKV